MAAAHPVDSMSDADLLAAYSGQPAGAAPAPAAPNVDNMSDDELLRRFSGADIRKAFETADKAKGAPSAAPAAATGANIRAAFEAKDSADAAAVQRTANGDTRGQGYQLSRAPVLNFIMNADRGLVRGITDVGATIGGLVGHSNDVLSASEAGQPDAATNGTGSRIDAANAADRAAYEARYGNSGGALAGRVAGNVAATLPIMAAGGEVAGGIAAGTRAIPYVAPVVDALSGAASTGNRLYNAALNLVGRGASGAVQGGTANALVSSASDQPLSDQVEAGALTGGLINAGVPAAVNTGRAIRSLATGGGVNSEVAALARRAEELGVPIRGGQISGSPIVKYTDSALNSLPFSGYAGQTARAHDAFTAAVSRTFGENSPALTSDVMQRAKTRLGAMFNEAARNTTIAADDQFTGDLARIESEAHQVLPSSEFTPIKTQMDNILGKVSGAGTIDGQTYQTLTRKGAPLDRAMSSNDSNVRYYAEQVRGALDDALERSASPETLDMLQTARRQYKNMKTVEDLVQKSPDGRISPALLQNEVRKSYGTVDRAGDLGDLAKIGQRFLKEPPNSGTATRNLIHAALAGGGVVGEGTLLLHDPHLAAMALGGAAASAGVSRLLGSALNSTAYRNHLLASVYPGLASRALQAAPSGLVPAGSLTVNRLLPQGGVSSDNALAPAQ